MSRSNGPATQPAHWPPQRPSGAQGAGAPGEAAGWTGQAAPYPGQQSAPPAGAYGAPQGQGYWSEPPPGYGAPSVAPQATPGYAAPYQPDPSYPQTQPGQRRGPPASHQGAHHQAPHADPYAQPGAYDPSPYDPYAAPSAYAGQPQPTGPGYADYPAPQQPAYTHPPASPQGAYGGELSSLQRTPQAHSHDPYAAPDLRGPQFDQWAPPPAEPAPRSAYDSAFSGRVDVRHEPVFPDWQSQIDPRTGDPRTGDTRTAPPRYAAPPEPAFDPYGQSLQSHHAAPQAQTFDPYAMPTMQVGMDPRNDANQQVDPRTGRQIEPAYAHDQHDDAAEFEVEEPKPRRWGLMAAALVGAIAVGGGATYGYKTYIAAPPKQVAPVVKNNAGPAKVKPAEPGGKQFAHSDSKIMGRLGEGGPAAPAAASSAVAAGEADASGTRKVQTMVIGRDGSITPAAPAAEAAPTVAASLAQPGAAQPRPPIAVPGMTIVDGFGGRPPAASIAAAAGAAPPVTAAAPPRPIVVNPPAAAPPPAAPFQAAPVPAAPPVAAAPARPVVVAKSTPATTVTDVAPAVVPQKKAPVPKKAATAAAPAAAGGAVATGGNGYVAVLASVPASSKSNMDALKQFADMQQKYGTALANKTPEVREANLGDKGTYHRLLVGPPGSREQAGQLCSELKAAGYGSCWVTAY